MQTPMSIYFLYRKNLFYMKKNETTVSVKMFEGAPPISFRFARRHRDNPTPAEAILWDALKNKQLSGYKFRREHPVSNYIVDFYCHSKKVTVEVDGGYHFTPHQKAYDDYRTSVLNELGITVIRFTNEEVINNCKGVLEQILEALNKV